MKTLFICTLLLVCLWHTQESFGTEQDEKKQEDLSGREERDEVPKEEGNPTQKERKEPNEEKNLKEKEMEECEEKEETGERENMYSKEKNQPEDNKKPNIVFILADDLGWNDIGYNNDQVITPIMDKLAKEGRILTNNYVLPVCTPSRHAFLSGRHPYATTMQHGMLSPVTPHCSPLDLQFFPEKLQDLQYETAIVGKWHIGDCRQECTPLHRGFDHQYGLMNGAGDFYTHKLQAWYDFRKDMVTDWNASGYSTELFRDRLVDHIETATKPLFLFAAFTAPHTPLQVPQHYYDMYANIENKDRRKYLAMVTSLDDAVGSIVKALKAKNMWDNTLLVFSSDNGGEVCLENDIYSENYADNFPLRGCKASLWEGGTRVVGFVSGGAIQEAGKPHNGLMHIVDWFPTLLHVAGGPCDADATATDGLDQYDMIMKGGPSVRDEIVYNIDMVPGSLFGQAAIRVGDYKLIWGHEGICDGWGLGVTKFWQIEEQCRAAGLNDSVCPAYTAEGTPVVGSIYSKEEIYAQNAIVESKQFNVTDINSGLVHLFNLADDPYEKNDLADDTAYSGIIKDLKQKIIEKVNNEYVPPPPNAFEMVPPIKYLESNPDDPSQKAWGIGGCENLDITLPGK